MSNVIQKANNDERSNLAANCGQIFAKGPQLTKDIVTKVRRTDLRNDRKFLCGHEFKTKHIWVLAGLMMFFAFSLFGTIILCFTDYLDRIILTKLILVNGSENYENFVKPASPEIKVYIFNYTNVDDFEKGKADKLHVKEVGPYAFIETLERTNLEFGENDNTLTFQEKKSFKFSPELSKGHRQSDQLIIPNMPMLGTVAMVREAYFMTRVTLSTVLKGLNAKPFLKLPAHKFIWGYDDSFFSLIKGVLSFQQELPFEKFGLLSPHNGTSVDRITINTGIQNLNDLGVITKFNGQDHMGHWSTSECNRIDGTLGSFFSPYKIRDKKPVSIYQKDLCRKMNFYFEKEVKVIDGSYPAYRYKPADIIFANPEIEPSNQCFCDLETGVCPPHGIMNATPCSFGPTYLSFPHYLYGDEKLHEDVEGLAPDANKHETFLHIHPTFGYTMGGRTRIQLNMLVRKAFGIPQVDMFKDETMLPIAWFETGIDAEDLPQKYQDIFYKTTVLIPYVEVILKYGCILMTMVTLLTIGLIVQARFRSKRPMRTLPHPFQRNISGLDSLIN